MTSRQNCRRKAGLSAARNAGLFGAPCRMNDGEIEADEQTATPAVSASMMKPREQAVGLGRRGTRRGRNPKVTACCGRASEKRMDDADDGSFAAHEENAEKEDEPRGKPEPEAERASERASEARRGLRQGALVHSFRRKKKCGKTRKRRNPGVSALAPATAETIPFPRATLPVSLGRRKKCDTLEKARQAVRSVFSGLGDGRRPPMREPLARLRENARDDILPRRRNERSSKRRGRPRGA